VAVALGGDCLADIAVVRAEPGLSGPVASDPVLSQLPRHARRRVLVRADSADGGTHEFLAWLTRPGRRLACPAGFPMTGQVRDAILKVPARAWTPAYDAGGLVREGAWIAELTGLPGLADRPKSMRVIVRKERPHPAAQLRFPRSRLDRG
jgi:hypothetical protein